MEILGQPAIQELAQEWPYHAMLGDSSIVVCRLRPVPPVEGFASNMFPGGVKMTERLMRLYFR